MLPRGPVWPALMCTVSWYWASGLVDQTGNVDAVVGEGVIGIGSVIPLHMGELSEGAKSLRV